MTRTVFQLAAVFLGAAALVALPGCSGSDTPAACTPESTGHYEGDGHDHSEHTADHAGHDHEEGETEQVVTDLP